MRYFCQGIFGGTLKYDRERDWNERKQFGENFRKCQEGATLGCQSYQIVYISCMQ